MKVHLGSGNKYLEGWCNVDLYADKVDVREDLRTIDFPDGTVDRIRLIHTIEHLDREDGVELLERCFRWLKVDGIIEIETPDKKKCYNLLLEGKPLEGAKGLFGGRSNNKDGWHSWLKRWVKSDRFHDKTELPEEWNIKGENHLYVWETYELPNEIIRIGFEFRFETPKHHGRRHWRDMRIVGTKPCE